TRGMDSVTALIIGIAVGLLLGALAGWLIAKVTSPLPKKLAEAELQRVELESRVREFEANLNLTATELGELEAEFKQVQDRMIEAEKQASAGQAKTSALTEQINQLL